MYPTLVRARNLLLLILAWYAFPSATAVLQAAPLGSGMNECQYACGSSASCGEECIVWIYFDEFEELTCGEYDDGFHNDWCDISTWDSCEYECPFVGSASDSCYAEGEEETCSTYGGAYGYCGDGYCSTELSEDGDSCSADCAANPDSAPTDPYSSEYDDWIDAANEITALTINDEEDAIEILQILDNYGLLDSYSQSLLASRPQPVEECEAALLPVEAVQVPGSGDDAVSAVRCWTVVPDLEECPPEAAVTAGVYAGVLAAGSFIWGTAAGILAPKRKDAPRDSLLSDVGSANLTEAVARETGGMAPEMVAARLLRTYDRS